MIFTVKVSALLLVSLTAVFAVEETATTCNADLAVITTEKLREEIKCVLHSELSHVIIPGLTPSNPAFSCKEILQLAPDSPSGYY